LKLKEYKELILQHKFFEAHEILEEFWFPRRKNKSSEVLIAKGFINAAVAFELKKRSRDKSAQRVFKTYIKFSKLIGDNKEFLELKNFVDNFATEWLKDTP